MSSNYEARQEMLLKANQRLVLVHPTNGFLPFHIDALEPFYMEYNRLLTVAGVTSIAGGGTVDAVQLYDNINRDMIEIKSRNLLYHVAIGVGPTSLKMWPEFPKGVTQRVPDTQNYSPTAKFGYIDGWKSPFLDPSPVAEALWPYGRNMTAFRFHNPTTRPMTNPLLSFDGNKYRVRVIRDVDLVQSILEERPGAAARKVTLGGLISYSHDPREGYDADWIPFDWDRQAIAEALATSEEGR